MKSYVVGSTFVSVVYCVSRIPCCSRVSPTTYVPIPRGVVAVSVGSAVSASAYQSLHPSPGDSASLRPRQLPLPPPTRRFERPWVYSWMITLESRAASRLGLVYFQTYSCIRGFWPSGGVAKFALFSPPPS